MPCRPIRLVCFLAALTLVALPLPSISAQGIAVSGRRAQPRKPLPEGMRLPQMAYRDIAREAGLIGVNVSGAEQGKVYIVETTGTGVAILDYDNDGLMDLFFVNGDRLGDEAGKSRHHLYRNLGELKFKDVTADAGIGHTGWGQGVCAGDVDNDTHTDLLVTHWGSHVLLRNQGDGTFRDEAKSRGLLSPGKRWSTGCAFLDYDRDGDLDLFVANYVRFDPAKTPKPGESEECRWKGVPVLCGPRGLPPETMSLYRNDGKGVFEDVSDAAGVTVPREYYGFTPLTADFDDDGWTDIYVACDSTAGLLYHNQKDGTFEEVGVISGTAYNVDGMEQAGMGVTAGDYDRDGKLDIFKTNFSSDTHTLYRNEGEMFFTDETIRAGLAVNTQYLGWGTAFLDVDQDGWKDIFVANGHVYPGIENTSPSETFVQRRLLYWNRRDGSFHDASGEAGPAISAKHSSRGAAVGDLDNDGSLEIVVVNMHDAPSLLTNGGERGGALLVQALTAEGRDAIGARIRVTTGDQAQIDEVRSGGYHISQSDFRVHFGLGSAGAADVEIRWPDGRTSRFEDVDAGHWIVVQQGKGMVKKTPFSSHED
ncbi:MAG: CRTAC1 family protein [Acidobacteria bacterium]|nr:CRTAC1 family protein [Acidobacteriota bacterium]